MDGGRTSGGADRQQSTRRDDQGRRGLPDIRQRAAAEHCRRRWIRSSHARGAGGAMSRGLQLTEEIVVSKGRRNQEDRVERQSDGCQPT